MPSSYPFLLSGTLGEIFGPLPEREGLVDSVRRPNAAGRGKPLVEFVKTFTEETAAGDLRKTDSTIGKIVK